MAVNRTVTTAVIAAAAVAGIAGAEFVSYEGDAVGWFIDAGNTSAITFDDFDESTFVTDQYASLGVHFLESSFDVAEQSPSAFPRDHWGLFGGVRTEILFDTPINAFATHHPGQLRLEFFLGSELLFESQLEGGGGVDFFTGFIAEGEVFDRIVARGFDSSDSINFDNMYFSTIPAPGAFALLTGLGTQRRRRA